MTITPRTNGDDKPMKFALCQEELDYFISLNDRAVPEDFKEYDMDGYLCSAVGNALSIDVKGNVYPCNSFLSLYGNIHSNSLREIWYELPARQKLKSIKKSDIKTCVLCELNRLCNKCPGINYHDETSFEQCSHWDSMITISKLKSFDGGNV